MNHQPASQPDGSDGCTDGWTVGVQLSTVVGIYVCMLIILCIASRHAAEYIQSTGPHRTKIHVYRQIRPRLSSHRLVTRKLPAPAPALLDLLINLAHATITA
jgi:hypothetical protein